MPMVLGGKVMKEMLRDNKEDFGSSCCGCEFESITRNFEKKTINKLVKIWLPTNTDLRLQEAEKVICK